MEFFDGVLTTKDNWTAKIGDGITKNKGVQQEEENNNKRTFMGATKHAKVENDPPVKKSEA